MKARIVGNLALIACLLTHTSVRAEPFNFVSCPLSNGRLAFGALPAPPAQELKPPFLARDFEVPFDFDGLLGVKHPQFLKPILDYAIAAKARKIEMIAFRGAARLADQTVLRERASIVQERARQVLDTLQGAGLSHVAFTTSVQDAPDPTGNEDWRYRKIDVRVTP